jgi:hypothetical protein
VSCCPKNWDPALERGGRCNLLRARTGGLRQAPTGVSVEILCTGLVDSSSAESLRLKGFEDSRIHLGGPAGLKCAAQAVAISVFDNLVERASREMNCSS